MKHRIKAIFAAVIFAAALLLPSCKSGSGVTLSLLGKKSDLEKSYMKSVISQYEEKTGNKIKVIAIKDADFETYAAEQFESGNAPDIFMHFNNADLNRFDVTNVFYYLNDQSWVNDLTDSAKAYCVDENGNLLGLPFWESSVSGCYYNKTLLDSLGLNPASTQAEFDMLCEAIAEAGYTPICWPADGCSWMVQFGLDPIFADNPENLDKINSGEASYADFPEIKNMVSWLYNAAQKGWFGSDYLDCGWDDISKKMGSGYAAMTFIWDTWFYTDFKDGQKYSIDDFALMPVFLNTVDGGTYEGGNLNMMMVNKNGDKLNEALEFLEFCATPNNYNAAFDGISTVNSFKGQNTNIQSKMVSDAKDSIKEKERVSTASSRIIGYSGDDMVLALNDMFRGKCDIDGCIKMMDDYRLAEISSDYGSTILTS